MAKLNTSITTRDKKLLLSFLGIVLFVLSFALIYRPYNEKNEVLKQENQEKKEELSRLLDLKEKEDYFITETNTMKKESAQLIQKFPAEVLEEDGILLVKNLEAEVDVDADTINIGNREFLYSPDGTVVTGDGEEDSQTLAEKSGEATQNAVNELEGVEESQDQNQTSQVYTGNDRALYRNQNTIQFKTGYQGVKDIFNFLAKQPERVTVDTINLTYDNTTGALSGDLSLNFFSMTSDDAEYQEKDAGKISLGTDNIFGTIDTTKKTTKKKTSTEKSTQTNTSKTKSTQTKTNTSN